MSVLNERTCIELDVSELRVLMTAMHALKWGMDDSEADWLATHPIFAKIYRELSRAQAQALPQEQQRSPSALDADPQRLALVITRIKRMAMWKYWDRKTRERVVQALSSPFETDAETMTALVALLAQRSFLRVGRPGGEKEKRLSSLRPPRMSRAHVLGELALRFTTRCVDTRCRAETMPFLQRGVTAWKRASAWFVMARRRERLLLMHSFHDCGDMRCARVNAFDPFLLWS